MYGSANDDDQKFIQNLSMFFGTSLRVYSASLFERQMGYEGPVSDAHQYLLKLSMVDDTENFKICLDYWNALSRELYMDHPMIAGSVAGYYRAQSAPGSTTLGSSRAQPPLSDAGASRKAFFAPVLNSVCFRS